MTALTKKMTRAEYLALEFEDTDNFQYELLNGEIVKKASPTLRHQRRVAEFWIVDPNNRSVEVYQLQDGKYKLFAFAAESGKVQSSVLQDLEMEVAEIFG